MPVLNRIRLWCIEGDRGSLQVKSNLDATYKLEHRTDDDICWTDDDVVAIQNKRGTACSIIVSVIAAPEGRRVILRPSRQAHKVLLPPDVSVIRSECELKLGGGETCMLTSSEFKGRTGAGAVFPV